MATTAPGELHAGEKTDWGAIFGCVLIGAGALYFGIECFDPDYHPTGKGGIGKVRLLSAIFAWLFEHVPHWLLGVVLIAVGLFFAWVGLSLIRDIFNPTRVLDIDAMGIESHHAAGKGRLAWPDVGDVSVVDKKLTVTGRGGTPVLVVPTDEINTRLYKIYHAIYTHRPDLKEPR